MNSYHRSKSLTEADLGVLQREFHTVITTSSGTVSGSLLHGNGGYTSVTTSSGSISLSFLTTGTGSKENLSSITTTTHSGSQSIDVYNVNSDKFNSGSSGTKEAGKMTALRARHHSQGSGSISASYPAEWEGMAHASCKGSGSVKVKGKDLEYQYQGQSDVYAWRGENGNEETTVELRSDGSGSLKFKC